MDVPAHLSAFGDAKGQDFRTTATATSDDPNIALNMKVPDRIVVTSANELMEARPEAAEVIANHLAAETIKQVWALFCTYIFL